MWLPHHLNLAILVLLLAAFIQSTTSLCLSSSGNLTPALCFDNQTDPNLANHRMSNDDDHQDGSDEDNDGDGGGDDRDTANATITSADDTFVPLNKSYVSSSSFEPRTSIDIPHARVVRVGGRRKTSKTRYYIQPSASHHHYDVVRRPSTTAAATAKDSMFIPVAAYSITKHKPKAKKRPHYHYPIYYTNRHRVLPSASSAVTIRQRRPNTSLTNLMGSSSNLGVGIDNDNADDGDELSNSDHDHDAGGGGGDEGDHSPAASEEDATSDDEYETKKESAVYGYIRKPEVIEFRGQYYYGNGQPIDRFGGQSSEHDPVGKYDTKADYDDAPHEAAAMIHDHKHVDHYIPMATYEHFPHDISIVSLLLAKIKKSKLIFSRIELY